MKKRICILITGILCIALTACSGTPAANTNASKDTEAPSATSSEPDMPGALYTSVLITDMSCGAADSEGLISEEPFETEFEPDAATLASALSEKTGLDFFAEISETEDGFIVDWAANSTLIANLDDREQKEGFHFFDADSMRWFMMDSLWRTLTANYDVENIYYTMDGGQELAFEELYPVSTFPSDVLYMGSAFYLAHADVQGGEGGLDDIIDGDAALGIAQTAMRERGDEAPVVVLAGEETINGELCYVVEGGSNSEDGTKFTAMYHYAVSTSGSIYYMDVVQGGDWSLYE